MDNLSVPISHAGLVRVVCDTQADQQYGDRARSVSDALRPETPNVAMSASALASEDDDPLAKHGFSPKKVRTAISELCSAIRSALDDERATAEESLRRAAEILREMGETGSLPGNERSRGGLAPWQIRKVTNYVDAHLDQTIRNEDLATIARLNASHFGRAFRNSFGEPPHEYVIRRRVERAQGLMLSTSAPLSAIALDCGLADQAHLSRLFRRVVGESPRTWRRARLGEPA
jgi:AraC family transcriptional regulator